MELTQEMCNGLRPRTERDYQLFSECQAKAVPLSALWEDRDDDAKVVSWDAAWERFIQHRAGLIEAMGKERFLPWNIYKELNLDWLDGYDFVQQVGDCGSMGHKNSLKTSNLTNALFTGRKPREIACSVMYGIARGDGKMNFGNGCNLDPLAKYSAEKGNYWTEDFGPYDAGRYCKKYRPGGVQDEHAKKSQSVIVYLAEPEFDLVYNACAAGFGVNMGSSIYPTGSSLNEDNLGEVDGFGSGGHCMAWVASTVGKKTGRRYVYLENSHPTKYASDELNPGHQWGVWVDERRFKKIANNAFIYGNWYVNIGELG